MSEEKKTKTTYKLYVTRTTDEVINIVSDLRFVRVMPKYTLIYSQNENIMQNIFGSIDYTIIGDEEVGRLSSDDKAWLLDCNFTIIAEEAIKNQELVLQNMTDALRNLEEELEKHRKDGTAAPADGESKES